MTDNLKKKFALIIDDQTLEILFKTESSFIEFMKISIKCEAVLCCRMKPAQKAQVRN
jgi:magnesium-transporting ATPase (P-type)